MDTKGLIGKLSEFITPFSEKVPGELCKEHSIAYLNALKSGTTWAIKMWDSSAKPQTGLISGNLNSMGTFDECIKVRDVHATRGSFSGQQCLAMLKFDNISATDAMGEMMKQVMQEEEEINIGLGALLSKGLRWGFCIPSSCTSGDLTVALSEHLGTESGVEVSVNSTDCHFAGVKPFSSSDWVAIGLFSFLLFAVFLSTGYEVFLEYLNRNPFWSFISIGRSRTEHSMPKDLSSASGPQTAPRGAEETTQPSTLYSSCQTISTGTSSIPSSRTASRAGSQAGSRPSSPTKLQTETRPQTLDLLTQEVRTGILSSSRPPSRTASRAGSQAGSRPSSPTKLQTETRPQTLDLPTQEVRTGSRPASPGALERGLAPQEGIDDTTGEDVPLPQNVDTSPIRAPESKCDPWASFSLLSNGRKLFSFETEPAALQCLYGIKFLSICWVLIGHTCFITESLPAINYVSIKYYATQWVAMPILNASLAADTFMVVTGALISYNFLRDMKKRGIYCPSTNSVSRSGLTGWCVNKYFLLFMGHRNVRLSPSLAVVMLFQVSLLNHLGSGPFWDSGLGYQTEVCSNYWWITLFNFQSYVTADKICFPHSWYVVVDMVLHALSPLILVLLMALNKMLSLITIGILVLMGNTGSFLVNYFLEIPAGILSGDPSKWPLKNRFDYMAPHTRFAPWMVGIAVGYILQSYRQRGKIQLKMGKCKVFLGWTLTSVALLYAVFGVFTFQQPNYEYDALNSSLYSSVHHTIWALGIGWIIIACESNYGGIVQDMLSWKIFRPLSRLTLCIYLIHLPLMTSRALMTRVPIYINEVTAMSSFFGDFVFSALLAIPLSLFVELPFIRLFKFITIKLGLPIRHIPPMQQSKRIPLLRDFAVVSYQAIASSVSSYSRVPTPTLEADSEPGPSGSEPIAETNPQETSEGAPLEVSKVSPSSEGVQQVEIPSSGPSSSAETNPLEISSKGAALEVSKVAPSSEVVQQVEIPSSQVAKEK